MEKLKKNYTSQSASFNSSLKYYLSISKDSLDYLKLM